MKKFLLALAALAAVFAVLMQAGVFVPYGLSPFFKKTQGEGSSLGDKYTFETVKGVRYRSRAQGNNFEFFSQGEWSKTFLTGVNIGTSEPGLFPGDLTVSYEDYYRWLGMIHDMNVNSIRVYTILRPQFYQALLDYNQTTDTPLWLFQGVWVDEELVDSLGDVYAQNGKIAASFTEDAQSAVDVIHGKASLPARAGFASGEYTADVSRYLAGWLLGVEWDPKLVVSTNQNNPSKGSYEGDYLYTLSATPFEAFLCGVGDEVIAYETDAYKMQAPVGFVNWVTTDPLTHPNEPHADEDLVTVDTENIKSRDTYLPGQYACYHVYPYYPDSMNYQTDYVNYVDPSGKINPYRAYLRDLKPAHTMPVIIGEFGIPTSRGAAHTSVVGYDQGGVDETAQGAMLLDMFQSMYDENYAGGLLFMWQDEWFKRTWNTEKFDVAERRPFWSNEQTNEQFFGLLAFDPGQTAACVVDGKADDWEGVQPLATSAAGSLSMKSDERYVYFLVKSDTYDFEKDTLLIPLDTIADQGNLFLKDSAATFDKAADFLIRIHGKDDSRIQVDSYYDAFYYLYGEQYKMLSPVGDIRTRNSGRFSNMLQCLNYDLTILPSGKEVPFGSYETGKLTFGNADPGAEDYLSLTDFSYRDGVLEIRIPWLLLNVMDPSTRQIMSNFYAMQSITPTDAGDWSVGLGVLGASGSPVSLNGVFRWEKWQTPTWHERLKPAYYALQKGLTAFR